MRLDLVFIKLWKRKAGSSFYCHSIKALKKFFLLHMFKLQQMEFLQCLRAHISFIGSLSTVRQVAEHAHKSFKNEILPDVLRIINLLMVCLLKFCNLTLLTSAYDVLFCYYSKAFKTQNSFVCRLNLIIGKQCKSALWLRGLSKHY